MEGRGRREGVHVFHCVRYPILIVYMWGISLTYIRIGEEVTQGPIFISNGNVGGHCNDVTHGYNTAYFIDDVMCGWGLMVSMYTYCSLPQLWQAVPTHSSS